MSRGYGTAIVWPHSSMSPIVALDVYIKFECIGPGFILTLCHRDYCLARFGCVLSPRGGNITSEKVELGQFESAAKAIAAASARQKTFLWQISTEGKLESR